MFAQSRARPGQRRRGIVLILILAMLSIMALIGVTFATISGQAEVGARYYAQAQNNPDPRAIFDYALEQVVNDTNNPKSAIRGHSLLRDMYGNDGYNNDYFPVMPPPFNSPLTYTIYNTSGNIYQIQTEIPTDANSLIQVVPQLYGKSFVGYTLRLQEWLFQGGVPVRQNVPPITQTFEITKDFDSGSGTHVFELSPADANPQLCQPTLTAQGTVPAGYTAVKIFELDGRYRRGFNGTGMTLGNGAVLPDRPNFLYNLPFNPTTGTYDATTAYGANDPIGRLLPNGTRLAAPSMDEDYDAVDAENMFLGLQSADGDLVIPSYHRPNSIVYDPTDPTNPAVNDWINYPSSVAGAALLNAAKRAKFLRPRKADHPASGDSFPDLIPDPTTGKITYDVDNDGDGVTDAVWLDLGFPVQRDATGRMYKPLFAITVLGLNGRLPLNTVGNLQSRDPVTGQRTTGANPLVINYNGNALTVPGDHISHLGYSPFEINPKFAFYESATDDGLQSLQKILVGDPNSGVAGRYGELGAFSIPPGAPTNGPKLPQAGRSYSSSGDAYSTATTRINEYFDNNFNATDFYPQITLNGTNYQTYPEQMDLPDVAVGYGYTQLPSERAQRFVTPLDTTGNGLLMEYDRVPIAQTGTPADIPGGPTVSQPYQFTPPGGSAINITYGLGFDRYGRVGYFQYFRPPGVPAGSVLDSNSDGNLTDEDITKNRANLYHGYEFHRNPSGDNYAPTPAREFMARAPFNVVPASGAADLNKRLPTFDHGINSTVYPPNNVGPPKVLTQGMYPDGSFALNEDFQMDLYGQTHYDEPFDNSDLEWLYRRNDPDSSALGSRLNSLATWNDTRERLFSVNTWETNQYSWTDNFFAPGNTPSIALRGRKVNLNYPLPASDDYNEPIRLKWCRETYAMLKSVLYTSAGVTPTAEELAELGQYVVNIVDYRDPDATMTRFVNPDLEVKPATGTTPAGVQKVTTAGSGTLVQWGMEYLPVALNEVLAYQYIYKNTSNQAQSDRRLIIELANMLTEDADGTAGANGTASHLDLNGWGVIITADNATNAGSTPVEQPNTATGQLADTSRFVPLAGSVGTPAPLTQRAEALKVDGLPNQQAAGNDNHYLIGTALPTVNYNGGVGVNGGNPGQTVPEDNPPNLDSTLLPEVAQQLPLYTMGSGNKGYFWLHLLRPANPNSTAMATEPKVVVDSFRFIYSEAGITINNINSTTETPTPDTTTTGTALPPLYSLGRSQPYRGGHAIPSAETFLPPFPHGYSEQASVQNQINNNDAFYLYDQTGLPQKRKVIAPSTGNIYHSLGVDNRPRENWDYLPFLDRDFASVAELMLVPSCPPGLFTKKFAEDAGRGDPASPFTAPFPYATPPTIPDSAVTNGGGPPGYPDTPDLTEPHPYPYLPHKFYYTTAAAAGQNAGWYRMLEFFEVPSPVFGAIGPVARGDNGDWFRQDVKPGLLNLNLIYDEEVFLGLIDDPRLNYAAIAPNQTPQVITSIFADGSASASHAMTNRGYGAANAGPMKAAFADFLKLRHGGSGYLGVLKTNAAGLAAEKPYRGFTAFNTVAGLDIYDTLLRPARLEGSSSNSAGTINGYEAVMPITTQIPPRRLFQVPDYYNGSDTNETGVIQSPASEFGVFTDGSVIVSPNTNLANTNASLFPQINQSAVNDAQRAAFLGGGYRMIAGGGGGPNKSADRRRHPYFRNELLQKVMNLTTVRTHQYAVWITVGFWEVVQEGNAQVLTDPTNDPFLAVDQLGREIGSEGGKAVRYRMFLVIDRSRATGFDPNEPDDFRNVVVFQRRIE